MSGADDIISPPIQVIGQRRYRVNVIHKDYKGPRPNPVKTENASYVEPDLFDEDDEDTYDIKELESSGFKSAFHVPRAFYGGLIGNKGMTKKRIESETKTAITIPALKFNDDSIVTVTGKTRKDVCAARRRIELVIESLRSKTRPTHFVCVPACTEDLKKGFNKFKESVLAERFPSIDERLFISEEKIHITFATCALLDTEERVEAGKIFMECKQFLDNQPAIEICVQGLEIMNDDPSAVAVLYARIECPELQIIADKVFHKFKDARLNNEDRRDNCKLHMTIMNARYRTEKDEGSLGTFDARHILKKYDAFYFGKFRLTEIHLSQMHTTGVNGFYKASGIVSVKSQCE